jgi:hypothetical protein
MLNKNLPSEYTSLTDLIADLKKGVQLEIEQTSVPKSNLSNKFDFSWQGTR